MFKYLSISFVFAILLKVNLKSKLWQCINNHKRTHLEKFRAFKWHAIKRNVLLLNEIIFKYKLKYDTKKINNYE